MATCGSIKNGCGLLLKYFQGLNTTLRLLYQIYILVFFPANRSTLGSLDIQNHLLYNNRKIATWLVSILFSTIILVPCSYDHCRFIMILHLTWSCQNITPTSRVHMRHACVQKKIITNKNFTFMERHVRHQHIQYNTTITFMDIEF